VDAAAVILLRTLHTKVYSRIEHVAFSLIIKSHSPKPLRLNIKKKVKPSKPRLEPVGSSLAYI